MDFAPAQTTITGVERQLFKVGRDVHGRLGTAMHAADAAGGEHLDAGHVGDDHRGGDGRCAVFAAGAQDSQIAAGGLGDGVCPSCRSTRSPLRSDRPSGGRR